jgi:hypothetical protein
MHIYNITINIDDSAREAWLRWMQKTHIPDVLATGLFISCRFCRVLVDEESGTTWSIQYLVKDLETLKLYQEMYAPGLQKEHQEKFAGKFVAFRTVLELVEEFVQN